MQKILSLTLLIFSLGIHASENTKHEKLTELVDVMDMDSMLEAMYSQMEVMAQDISTQMGVQPSEQAVFDEYHSKMMLVMREDMNWKTMQPIVIKIYDKNFTEKEISEMLSFYKTETGQAILAKMPVVMQESMQMSQAFMQRTMPKIQEIARQLDADLKKMRSSK